MNYLISIAVSQHWGRIQQFHGAPGVRFQGLQNTTFTNYVNNTWISKYQINVFRGIKMEINNKTQ